MISRLFWLAALVVPLRSMTVVLPSTLLDIETSGGFVTTLMPATVTAEPTGLPASITTLFQQDYPGFTYVNATNPANGTLTINTLEAFQNGLQGGVIINAGFVPGAGAGAPDMFEWIQYLTINPLTTPFAGATSSPFTDPPPAQRDDTLPFYWTIAQSETPGLGYAIGGNYDDDPLFSDFPRVNDSRAPVDVGLFLYLTNFDSTNNVVTIYDGIQYGFEVAGVSATPELPPPLLTVAGALVLIYFHRLFA